MATTTEHRCRTCPAFLENYEGADQCVRCSERSRAVRAAVASEPLPVLHVKAPKPKIRSCVLDSHQACEHHQAIVAFLLEWMDDMAMCPACSADLPADAPDGAVVKHKTPCVLAAVTIRPAARATGEEA